MTEITGFTEEQTTALDALEAAFGPTEIDAGYAKVANLPQYAERAKSYGEYTRDAYAYFKLASDPDFVAKQARLEEEARLRREKELAERSLGIRESIVLGFMSGLLPKVNRAFEGGSVSLKMMGRNFSLYAESTDAGDYISMNYVREDFRLVTAVGDEILVESLTLINGNTRPRDQVKGLEAVHVFLDGLLGEAE